ncbi:MAG: hypothetical protein GQ583_11520 [Methyloprofundus sp.]|nr:hypothetical protein [Methyloprofundus sp.]
MMKSITIITLTATLLTGCTYYQPAPVVYSSSTTASKFDRSWSAAMGALSDQGVRISVQNRGAGIIQGNRNGVEVSANIRTQADGSVRVQFDTSGDPALINNITSSYNRRMGR